MQGKVRTIHNIPILIAEAFPKALLLQTSYLVFGKHRYSATEQGKNSWNIDTYLSYVSDRPETCRKRYGATTTRTKLFHAHTPDESTAIISPHVIRPFAAKAAPRSKTSKKKVTSSKC
ncbi:hypothetical protein RRG08_004841 [Elysia crispata]|uniref:Uncharacterized protein n=1 Tax=Elysia crispata TaxID=231223 RepID=A0AAE1A012_9GAST|nr:hypothetical protein RRG08_004841 [Elysia crispata]